MAVRVFNKCYYLESDFSWCTVIRKENVYVKFVSIWSNILMAGEKVYSNKTLYLKPFFPP